MQGALGDKALLAAADALRGVGAGADGGWHLMVVRTPLARRHSPLRREPEAPARQTPEPHPSRRLRAMDTGRRYLKLQCAAASEHAFSLRHGALWQSCGTAYEKKQEEEEKEEEGAGAAAHCVMACVGA
eukprot:3935507-Rhodomonas_salina.1